MKGAIEILTILVLMAAFSCGDEVRRGIQCHYCGLRQLCELPFVEERSEKFTCETACMKFDGYGVSGRVIIRECHHR